ncbi:MAG: hypothetical protein MUC83_19860 [Pirellula sp.]|nr:hypothetical protein [Pirellula sp.]
MRNQQMKRFANDFVKIKLRGVLLARIELIGTVSLDLAAYDTVALSMRTSKKGQEIEKWW